MKLLSSLTLAAVTVIPAAAIIAARPPAQEASPDSFAVVFRGLVDQDDRPFDPRQFAGRLVIVNFIFTGCGTTCPTQMAQLARFDQSLPPAQRRRLMLLSVSVDPAHDRPAQLRTYGKLFGTDGRRWRLLTGSPQDIARVTRSFAAMRPGEANAAFHTSEVRLFDARHRMIQRYAGAPLAEAQLRADILVLTAPNA